MSGTLIASTVLISSIVHQVNRLPVSITNESSIEAKHGREPLTISSEIGKPICSEIKQDKVLSFIYSKVNDSDFITPEDNLCKSLTVYININTSEITLTTKRIGRSYKICLNPKSSNGCEDIIAQVKKGIDPANALHYTFKNEIIRNDTQRETIERLFLKPSTLIQ